MSEPFPMIFKTKKTQHSTGIVIEETALGKEAEAGLHSLPLHLPPPESSGLTPFPNSVDCTAELFIKTVYNENIPFLSSMNPCNFLPPPGQRPLGQESVRKKKKLKSRAVKAKKTTGSPGFDNAVPQSPFQACWDTGIQEQGWLPSEARTMNGDTQGRGEKETGWILS